MRTREENRIYAVVNAMRCGGRGSVQFVSHLTQVLLQVRSCSLPTYFSISKDGNHCSLNFTVPVPTLNLVPPSSQLGCGWLDPTSTTSRHTRCLTVTCDWVTLTCMHMNTSAIRTGSSPLQYHIKLPSQHSRGISRMLITVT